jgi:acetyl esterase/lipase
LADAPRPRVLRPPAAVANRHGRAIFRARIPPASDLTDYNQVHWFRGVRIIRPRDAPGPLPVVVYCHGGGWIAGDTRTHDRLVREIAVGVGAALVFVRPRDAPGPLPVVVYCHGGRWIAGDTRTHDRLVREIAVGVGAALVFVCYDRAPEARFPTAIEQVRAATRYVAAHAAELNLDASRLAINCDCAGGAVATTVTKWRAGAGSRRSIRGC